MTKVIGVRFKETGKVYYFAPGDKDIKRGEHVIVETARGLEYGTVVLGVSEVEDDKIVAPLKPVVRVATPEDDTREETNREKEKKAFITCKEKIDKHNLPMKLINVEYTFDNSKAIFYYFSDNRVDFRELVKDLASTFHTRIEMRQVGVRDEAKLRGGIGICGRPICCNSYMADFSPVSIKMAKEQNLSLNALKISGVCGRLMCCLKNEEETYEELNRNLPYVGENVTVIADNTTGKVHSIDVLRQLVKVVIEVNDDEKELVTFKPEELRFKRGRGRKMELTDEEKKALKDLES
ncbi:MAG: stage 0 sporulation family protein [Lachnospiraceae bacterium]|jgi:cell fate regulator YaaT (PSP1 superfamily)|nr:stage 0 sporulation family protein [Lachnospiraceae bacterium]